MTESCNYGTAGERAHSMLKTHGYAEGGKVTATPKKEAARAVHKHERHLHRGEAETKLRSGGGVKGEAAASRPDRRARGGATKAKGKTEININVGKGDDQQADMAKQQMAAKAGLQKGVQIGRQIAAAPPPGAPRPGMNLPPNAGPPGAPPNMPPGPAQMMPPRKDGGKVPEMHAGAGNGEGRLEKADMIRVRSHHRRRSGGRCEE